MSTWDLMLPTVLAFQLRSAAALIASSGYSLAYRTIINVGPLPIVVAAGSSASISLLAANLNGQRNVLAQPAENGIENTLLSSFAEPSYYFTPFCTANSVVICQRELDAQMLCGASKHNSTISIHNAINDGTIGRRRVSSHQSIPSARANRSAGTLAKLSGWHRISIHPQSPLRPPRLQTFEFPIALDVTLVPPG